jgi:outer membrane protein assembly factor BamE (lipoprotein component of BamABCDE complex)
MRRVLAAALAATCFVGAASAGATIKPGRGMSRVELGMTPAQVQAKLGRPVAKGGFKWFYARVSVTFRNRRVVELMTTRSTERFANGLGVDSSEAEVKAAWPQLKCAAMPPFYRRCRLGTGAPGSRNTDFIFGTTRRVIYVIVTKLP